ncbi:MAG: ATP-binding protein [Terasakiella sp.]|uniref:ATP-binding protein n=1 Tax=unclassified Terasakiella TaxID=2614952 RepID=UPI003B009498
MQSSIKRLPEKQKTAMVALVCFMVLILCANMRAYAGLSFEKFSQNHNAVILVIDPKSGKIIDLNPSASTFYGYSRDELLKMGIQDINVLTKEEVAQERLRAKNERRNFFIFRHRLKNGEVKTVEVLSNPYEFNGKDVLISIIHDISRQREIQDDLWHYQTQLEQMVDRQTNKLVDSFQTQVTLLVSGIIVLLVMIAALGWAVKQQNEAKKSAQDKRKQLDEIIWSTNVGTFEWNIQTGIVNINDRFANMLGYSVEELEPVTVKTWQQNTHPEDLKVALSLLEKTFDRDLDYYETEFRMFHKNGSYIWILSKGNVVEWTHDGLPLRMSGTHSDITQRKEMEAELRKAKKSAEDANRTKSEFLATMSHELRTPMMGIRGILELLRGNDSIVREEGELLDDLEESSNNLMVLLDDILDLSKIEAGKLHLDKTVCSPAEILNNVVSLFRPGAVKKGLELNSHSGPFTDYWCEVDEIRLRQIISNLVSNAVKFTEQGQIDISMDVDKKEDGNDVLKVSIRDTGIGIPEDYLGIIFNRFSQADQSLSKKYGGTGLGLAISHELSEMMGGEFNVKSELNKGTTFALTLPVKAVQKPETALQPKNRILPPLNVLMAEDNVINQKVISSMLSKGGHAVTIANNGLEAVEYAAKEAFDLILMDIQMPEMDGMEASREIRRTSGPNARKPIVAFTADAVKEHREDFLKSGIDAVVIKPVKFDVLCAEIAKVL